MAHESTARVRLLHCDVTTETDLGHRTATQERRKHEVVGIYDQRVAVGHGRHDGVMSGAAPWSLTSLRATRDSTDKLETTHVEGCGRSPMAGAQGRQFYAERLAVLTAKAIPAAVAATLARP